LGEEAGFAASGKDGFGFAELGGFIVEAELVGEGFSGAEGVGGFADVALGEGGAGGKEECVEFGGGGVGGVGGGVAGLAEVEGRR